MWWCNMLQGRTRGNIWWDYEMTYPREQINQGIFLSLSHPFDDHNDSESSGPLKDSNILMLITLLL